LYDLSTGVVTSHAKKKVSIGITFRRWLVTKLMGIAEFLDSGLNEPSAFFEENGYTWKSVVSAFASKDLDESAALQNARLAKILQHTDYDFNTESVKLWTPTSDC
jgi:hypothetical protein